MLAERNCAFSSAGSFQDAFRLRHTRPPDGSLRCSKPAIHTVFTNPLRVDRATILTFHMILRSHFGSKDRRFRHVTAESVATPRHGRRRCSPPGSKTFGMRSAGGKAGNAACAQSGTSRLRSRNRPSVVGVAVFDVTLIDSSNVIGSRVPAVEAVPASDPLGIDDVRRALV